MKQLGLLGRNISYSFSKNYFEEKFNQLELTNHHYDVFDIKSIEDVETIFRKPHLLGFNVTIPYKVEIIPYLDELSKEAESIGAVNTVKIENGKKIGYNTDAYGFEESLKSIRTKNHNSALVLGDGGASKAVQFVLEKNKIPFLIVSRKGKLNFDNLTDKMVSEHKLIIQCTPVGTSPNINDCLHFPFDGISEKHAVIDLIYNPEETQFMKNAKKNGAKAINGLLMLHQQAEQSWKIWNE